MYTSLEARRIGSPVPASRPVTRIRPYVKKHSANADWLPGSGNSSTVYLALCLSHTAVEHIQQWDAGFQPRTEAAQKLELVEITENSVKFEDVSGFGMPTLGYSNPDEDTFVIHVGQEGGNTFDIELKARSIW